MLSLPYIVELSKLDAIKSVNALKAEVDALRPLATETEQRIMQKLRLDWNYHSNSIEGNQLDYGETVAFLMHGLTAKGKPLKDHLDIRGHNEAILFLTSLVKDERGISEADIRALHKLILVEPYEVDALTPEGNPTKKWIRLGEYKRESNSVKTRTGETHFYATPEETPARMTDLMAWYQEAKTVAGIHPLVVAALFHHEFTAIHPFDDGNGRMARLLSNLILMQSSFPPVVVKKEDRNAYYSVLSQADAGSFASVVDYFGRLLAHSLEIYLRGSRGESIEEEADIDKEIALFKAEFNNELLNRLPRSRESIKNIFIESIYPAINKIRTKLAILNDLFFYNSDHFLIPNTYIENSDGDPIIPFVEKVEEAENIFNGLEGIYESFVLPYDTDFEHNALWRIIYVYSWSGFKASESQFHYNCQIFFTFEPYKYYISHQNIITENTISKYYNENLTERDIINITKSALKNSMKIIKQKANEP